MIQENFDPFSVQFVIQHYGDIGLNKELERVMLEEDKRYTGIRDRSKYISGLQNSPTNLLDADPCMQTLEIMITKIVDEYFKINKHLVSHPMTFRSWANILSKDERHATHGHADSALVLNYYVKCPKDTRIAFLASDQLHGNPTSQTLVVYNYDPKPGDLIASPPWLLHEVTPNYTDELRMSISTNVMM